ncbi:hypothetical protein BJ742DRAFT_737077 [Cladochytrium replicatum]|nr:hypothetical protein BJ742DRAFT_737077 [Cladochytrium replicatum]
MAKIMTKPHEPGILIENGEGFWRRANGSHEESLDEGLSGYNYNYHHAEHRCSEFGGDEDGEVGINEEIGPDGQKIIHVRRKITRSVVTSLTCSFNENDLETIPPSGSEIFWQPDMEDE